MALQGVVAVTGVTPMLTGYAEAILPSDDQVVLGEDGGMP